MFNRLRSFSWLGGSQVTLYDARRPKEPVLLNVYDLWHLNDYTYTLGLGIFHSGVQLYGTEYGYGGHELPMTGIFEIEPCNRNGELGEEFRFRESIVLGFTQLSRGEVRGVVEELGQQFSGQQYHVLTHNCNHFSNKLADVLCGRRIPGWINRLANLVARVPCLIPPQEQPPPRQRGPDYKY